jgi:hypothetical protein
MPSPFRSNARAASLARAVQVLVFGLAGVSARAFAQEGPLRLNHREYLEARGLNVVVFSREYKGMFFDEKTAGIEIIQHGVRIATGGAVRLKPTPEQWDQIPRLAGRTIDRERDTIEVTLRYDAFDFDARVAVRPEGKGFRMTVFLDKPVPSRLEGRAGLNLEFLPSTYFEKTYLVDGTPHIFPRYPAGPATVKPADSQVRQFEGYTTFDDRGRKEYVEALPFAAGTRLVLAPDDPQRRVTITTATGELQLLDGRTVAQNGWFVVRTPLPANATGKVAEWLVEPHAIPGWTRTPVIGFSQAGYHPAQPKVAVIELDRNDTPLAAASLVEVAADGTTTERMKLSVRPWGPYLRYAYATADFSAVDRPGLYYLQYGSERTETFPIAPTVYDGIWHLTNDVWFPVQMDHMRVNEAYRLWHGLPHMDDALQAPVAFQHFDGYKMGPTTETRYGPGERIPGLAVGGWFDAGDFDIETAHHAQAIVHLVDTWEAFRPTRDETLVDQATRFVDIHRPDGTPDLLQQIEHGTLAVLAQYKAFGRAIRGIVDPHLYQYTHLGDGGTQTDGLAYDPALGPNDADGRRSGVPDDRWAFTARVPATNYQSIGALAAASRALRGYDDTLADDCLAHAKKGYADERQHLAATPLAGPEAAFAQGAEIGAVLQLLATTKEQQYADRFTEIVWSALDRAPQWTVPSAVRALPYFDAAYKAKLQPYVAQYKASLDALATQNPYGVPIGTGGWAGNSGVIGWATAAYAVHRAFPELVGRDYALRGLEYILGRHPSSNVSFVSGVGAKSKTVAYGSNRADFAFIAGGVVPGVLILKPDFPENKDDWPFLWGENEYVIDIAAHYIFLAHAARDLLAR